MTIKTQSKTLLRVITFAAIIGLSMLSCHDNDDSGTRRTSGTVTANAEGVISFMYSRLDNSLPDYCTFTTNLQDSYHSFVVSIAPGESTGKMDITTLTPGQVVTWTVIVKEGMLSNSGSGNFVHIIND
ncbi:MAG: hypothetical protein LBR81_06635 [Prevotellaceae bacterium]|jgi:hypothetical protein|nr:hypothetical protein [Prevotellaceae bacterium]